MIEADKQALTNEIEKLKAENARLYRENTELWALQRGISHLEAADELSALARLS